MMGLDNTSIENDLRSIITEIAEIEPEKVTLDASFVEELGMDSMMALEVLASIEKKYKIQVPEEKLTKMTNLKEVVKLVNEFLKK